MKKFFQKLTNWEMWNFYVLYFPIGPVWLWYCLRSWSLWYFSSSNPTITFGGFEGEGKKEMYDQLPPDSYPRTIYIMHDLTFAEVLKKIAEAGFTFPFIVKPAFSFPQGSLTIPPNTIFNFTFFVMPFIVNSPHNV